MDDGADAHRRPPPPRSSRRRSRRRRPPAGSVDDGPVCRDPITQEEPRSSGLSPRRSGTRSQSRASSFPALVFYPDGSVGIPYPPEEVATTHGRRRPGARSQASSSSSAPRSNQRGAEGRTRVRPSVLYSDRVRNSQPRRLALAQEHVTSSIEVSSPVVNVPTVEALSLSDQPLSIPEKPQEIFYNLAALRTMTGSRIRPSVLYSDRPRRSRSRRPALAEEHPVLVSSSVDADLPTFEALSLSDPPLLTPQTIDDDETDTDEAATPEPIGFGFGTLGPQTLHYPAYPPRPKWTGGVRGQLVFDDSDANSSEPDDPLITDMSTSEKPIEDPDDDTEEELRLLEEYFEANPPVSMSEAFDKVRAAHHAALTSLAAEWGVEPPPPLPPRRQFLANQAQQKASAAVSHPQRSTVPREPSYRQEASEEEIVENAKKWMRDEVSMLFQNYIGRRDDLKIVDYHLDELCNQCVSVENYHKIFHHYNFTVKLKKADSDDWIGALYFAEVKQMFGRKSYFCCSLGQNENGLCYACKNQGVDDLRHPATGGFDKGWPNVDFGLCYLD